MLYLIAEKYISRMRMAYSNQPYGGGKILKSDNTVIDLVEFLESGQVVASTVATPSEVPTSTEGIVRSYDNFSPIALKIITPDNEIIDLIDFLMSGQLKVSVDGEIIAGGDIDTNGYSIIDSVNDIVTVDAEILKVRDQIASMTEGGVIDFSSPVQFSAATHQIRVPVGTNLQIYASSALDWIELLANTVNIKQSIIFNSSPINNMTYVNEVGVGEHEFWFNLNNITAMKVSPSGVRIPGTLEVDGDVTLNCPHTYVPHELVLSSVASVIRATNGNKVSIVSDDINTPIELVGNYVAVQSAICRRVSNGIYQTGNNITFGNQIQTYHISNASIFDISADGFRLGAGSRVNNITNSPSSVLATDIPTMYAVQTAIGNAVMGANPFRGFWDASGGTYPTTGGTGSGGDIEAGNWWRISVAGTLGGEPVDVGDQLFAGVNDPGQTPANWTNVNPRVFSVFTRTGDVVAAFGDYSFPLISGNIATAQLPNGGVNGNSQLVQLNGSGQLPALSGVNLTGLTGALSSVANNLNVSVNGGAASSNVSIINSNSLSSLTNSMTSNINGVSSSANIVNSISLSLTGNSLSATVNGQTSNTVTIATSLTFNAVTGSSQALAANNVYYITYNGECTTPLPTSNCEAGERFQIITGSGATTVKITQGSGQQLFFGAQNGVSASSTLGAGGYTVSFDPNTVIDIICVVDNTTFVVENCVNRLSGF